MRNKIFAAVFSLIFLFMFIGAPATLILTEKGIIEYNNVGNEIVADKIYDDSTALGKFFNSIEDGKVAIKDTYINNLPFFLKITNTYKPFKSSVDQPMINWLQDKGNESAVFVCKHVYSEETAEPTCTEGGYTLKTCRICSETVKENETAALGHNFEETSRAEASCESDGYTVMTCSLCSAIEQRDTVKASGHDYEKIYESPADCTTEGNLEYKCRVCGAGYSVSTPPAGHKYKDTVVEPVSGKAGYTLHECETCGHSYRDGFTETEDHVHSFTETKTAPACDKEGMTTKTCTLCGFAEEKDFIEPLGHDYRKSSVKASCTEGGYDLSECTRCGASYKENSVPPTGHKYTSTVVAPTCEEEGYTKQTCSACGSEQKINRTPAKGHSYTVKTVAPTYSEGGYDLHTCSVCLDSYKDNKTPKLESVIPEPTTTPDPEGTEYTASLKTTDKIFRHYEINAGLPGGPNKTTYARIVKLDRETMYNSMLEMVSLINTMVEIDRDVNWYFSFATNIEATEIGAKIMPQESTRYIYEDFLTKVDPSVKVSAVEVNSFEDYYSKFFITDHHWNHHGSEEAYLGIVKMLRENYPDIEPIPVKKVYNFTGVKFFGSLSRAHANYDVWDPFGLYYRELDEHTVRRDQAIGYGSKNDQATNLKTYTLKEHNTAQGYNHYTEFYRVCKEINYNNNKTGRNLLIIGDSYSLPLLEVVAAHFDRTYIRYEDRSFNNLPEELVYDEFIEENNITDVIVIEEMAKCIMKGYGNAYPCGFLNIVPSK